MPYGFAGGRFRKLRAAETPRLRGHLARLSDRDRRMRFCGHVSDRQLARYAHERSALDAVTLGWFADGHLRASGELLFVRRGWWDPRCEAALAVEGPYQGRGIGTELLRRLVVLARNRGVMSITLWCLAENHAMRAVASRLDFDLERQGGSIEGRLYPPWPDQLTLLEEAVSDGAGVLAMALDLQAPSIALVADSKSAKASSGA